MSILDITNCVAIAISYFSKSTISTACSINIPTAMLPENSWDNRISFFFKHGWFICTTKYTIEFELIWSLKITACLNSFDMISRRLWTGNREETFPLKSNVRKYPKFLVIVKSAWHVPIRIYFPGWQVKFLHWFYKKKSSLSSSIKCRILYKNTMQANWISNCIKLSYFQDNGSLLYKK